MSQHRLTIALNDGSVDFYAPMARLSIQPTVMIVVWLLTSVFFAALSWHATAYLATMLTSIALTYAAFCRRGVYRDWIAVMDELRVASNALWYHDARDESPPYATREHAQTALHRALHQSATQLSMIPMKLYNSIMLVGVLGVVWMFTEYALMYYSDDAGGKGISTLYGGWVNVLGMSLIGSWILSWVIVGWRCRCAIGHAAWLVPYLRGGDDLKRQSEAGMYRRDLTVICARWEHENDKWEATVYGQSQMLPQGKNGPVISIGQPLPDHTLVAWQHTERDGQSNDQCAVVDNHFKMA